MTNSHALRFAYSSINWGTRADLATMFAEIRQTGWGAVELFDHSLDWLGTPDRLKFLLGGLQAATFFGGISVPVDRNEIAVHKQRIDYAALFHAEAYGLVGGGRLRQRPPTAAEYSELAAACEELAIYAEDKGIAIGYHPHTGCTIETEDEIDILLNETKLMSLCLDVSHINLVDEDSIAHIRKYRERTSYIHMKDWARGKFVELGQGTIGLDFPAILAELADQQFPGWIVIEHSRSDISPAHSAGANAEYLRSIGYSIELPQKA